MASATAGNTPASSAVGTLALTTSATPPEWVNMTDLANATFGSRIQFATDEWFGPAGRLLLPCEPVFNDKFTEFGKWMDGWESRRKRVAGHDWCIIKLGLPGRIGGVLVDTAFFTGNQAPRFSLQGAWVPQEPDGLKELGEEWAASERVGLAANEEQLEKAARLGSEKWDEVIGMTPLQPGYEEGRRHYFAIEGATRKYTHLRLNIFPDGGIARLRIHGAVERTWEGVPADAEVDLLAVENGGVEVACSNRHYGEPKNMLKPGRGINMGDGWETARKPGRPAVLELGADGLVKAPGCDWAVLRLGVVGEIVRLVVDTNHFKGNFPESVVVDACLAPGADASHFSGGSGGERVGWKPLLRRHKVGSNREHVFELRRGEIERRGPVSHVKLSMMPDGGVMRLRAFGLRVASGQLSLL
eukprot:jgi/Undpi1/6690/HiC_scaffold_20.g09169.m1